jgi:hypothetical protein
MKPHRPAGSRRLAAEAARPPSPGAQHRAQELQDRLITDTFLHRLHQLITRNRRKAVSDVRLYHPPAAAPALIDEHLQGIVRRSPRAEPETDRQEIRLEDRLEHDLHRDLHDPVPDRRNRQRPLLVPRSRLGDIDPAPGQPTIAALLRPGSQLAGQPASTVLPDRGQVILSIPSAPLFACTIAHARRSTSLRRTLSCSAWNLRPGSALAARYSACCKARTGSAGTPGPIPSRRD